MKKAFFVILLFLDFKSYSQDTLLHKKGPILGLPSYYYADTILCKKFSVSTNICQIPLNEFSLFGDWRVNLRNGIGISIGYVYPNKNLDIFPFVGNNNVPGLVYKGFVTRFNYKYYFIKQFPGTYIEAQLSFRSVSYSNYIIDEQLGDGDDGNYYATARSERAEVYGLDILIGGRLNKISSSFLPELYGGLGLRERIRNIRDVDGYYDNPDVLADPSINPDPPKTKQIYPALVLGIKIGFCFKNKHIQKASKSS